MTGSGFRITVPASSANLGPGFDTFGMALALHDVVEVRVRESGLEVEVGDAGAGDIGAVPTDEGHLVVRALRRACAHLGVEVPGLRLRCHNAIPHARGLGSSAAAVVAGIAAGFALAGREAASEQDTVLKLAAEFEGHVDNAAASLLGGLVLAWCEGERFHARRLDPHPGVRPVLAVPAQRSSTDETRGLLPAEVPHADAAFTAGRAALLVHALTAAPELLLPATQDRLHQGYRAAAYPGTARLVDTLREHGLAAMVSGAGPAVLALTVDGTIPPGVDVTGFVVTELAVDLVGVQVVAA
ncbi:homoserine kinase [Amycolatopsis cihanbeyliensis]|uniref:Homoserine kinase n=1 Tax=Amycolatopsis cihanbeyliensis TaxID=1128664 RepID=A0A542DRB9_AMYCI|nr:homoserine kinase [Amycolatopsis cihanbeyliensis]TQJ05652.1 homoserine kinase [Amycolatopsis cihanbeyliensis]